MRTNWKKYLLFVLAAALFLALSACGTKKYPMHITVVNRTTYPIADVRISLDSDENWGPARIDTILYDGDSAEIDLGEYTREELDTVGFDVQFYGENDEPIYPDAEPGAIFPDDGDYLIFAPPGTGYRLFMDTAYDSEKYDRLIAESLESGDSDAKSDLSPYEGLWICEPRYDYDYMEIDSEGNWQLYRDQELAASGTLRYEAEWSSVYAYDDADGSGCVVALEDDRLYTASYGYFDRAKIEIDLPALAGDWYLDGDQETGSHLLIDTQGEWELFSFQPGDTERSWEDYGSIQTSDTDENICYAVSEFLDGPVYRIELLDGGLLYWGDSRDSYIRVDE